MFVGALDVPVLVVLGAGSAYWVGRRSDGADRYPVLTAVCVGLFWCGLGVANAAGHWIAPVSVPPVVGVPYALAYLLWFRAGAEAAFLLFGRRADQGGLLWVVRLGDRTDAIAPAWKNGDQND